MIEQRSEEWFSERLGKATASRIADIVAKTKTGWGASRANYMAQLIAERLTGVKQDSYVNAAMQHGIDTEAEARSAYEFYADATVAECGFIPHPAIAMSGASPDGIIGDDGLIEIKCPQTASHLDTLLGEPIPNKYTLQMQWQMACTGRKWCDWVSYDPRMPEEMRLFIRRVNRDGELIKELEANVSSFLAEIDEKVNALRLKYALPEAA